MNNRINDIRVKFLTLMFCGIFIQLFADEAKGQTIKSGEYNIKAVFIYNFTRFVVWPETAFENATAPFKIAVLGPDPFEGKLEAAVRGELVNGHPIVVERFNSWKDVGPGHILFISTDYTGDWKGHLSSLKGYHTLTVSDLPNFARSGGMIRFDTQANKIKLMINPSAAKASSLSISSKLLRLADIVDVE